MSEIKQNIQKKEFERRLHILKGFTNIDEVATVHINQLEKAVGNGNIYEYSGLQKMTQDVLAKGKKEEIFKAKKFINELNPINVIGEDGLPVTVFLEKGHMDFGGGKPKNSNLVEKKVTDKNGHQTTRYVKNGEDPKKDKQAKPEVESESGIPKEQNPGSLDYDKSPEDWASETSSEDLKKFIDTADDSDIVLIELAEEELMNRGDIEPGADEGGEEDFEDDSEDEQGLQTSDLDDNDTLVVYYQENLQAIQEIMAGDMDLNPRQASKIHLGHYNKDNSDTHAKIDAAQAALDDLKGATGHPGSGDSSGNSIIDNADPEDVESLRNSYSNMDQRTLERYADHEENDELEQELADREDYDYEDDGGNSYDDDFEQDDSESSRIADEVEKETYNDDSSQYKKDVKKDEQSYKDQVDSDEKSTIDSKITNFADTIRQDLLSEDKDSIISELETYQESYLGTFGKLMKDFSEVEKKEVNDIWNEYSGTEGTFEDSEKGFFDSENKNQAEKLAEEIGGEIEEQGGLIYVYDKDGNIYNG